jgi:uroporphyrin-III C-methyltransferase/precorrin-2 dehydrogenase/sirohydrochlorin ferrochelatase
MSLPALPLFHRIAGQPVIVLGHGEAAQAKRRLVERAGGQVIEDLAHGIDIGARLAFIAHDNPEACSADAARARGGVAGQRGGSPGAVRFHHAFAGRSQPGGGGGGHGRGFGRAGQACAAAAGARLPQGLGALADALYAAREALRARFPDGADRRRALDTALGEGGALDPMVAHDADAVAQWLDGAADVAPAHHVIALRSTDPEDLTLREARLLGMADAVVADPAIPGAILARARADAQRLPPGAPLPAGLTVELRLPA